MVTSSTGTVRRFDAGGTLVETAFRSGLRMVFDATGKRYDVFFPDGAHVGVGPVSEELLDVAEVSLDGRGPGVLPALSAVLDSAGLGVVEDTVQTWFLASDLTLTQRDAQGHVTSRAYADGRIGCTRTAPSPTAWRTGRVARSTPA